jgi:membrane associated rhomboid family serine protease
MIRNIPVITKNLLIINALVFVATFILGRVGVNLEQLFGLHFFMASNFGLYQLITYMFMHANLEHIFFNMFALWMFGCVVENVWGPKKFLTYYLTCGVGAGLIQELTQLGSFYFLATSQIPGIGFGDLAEVAANSQALLTQWTTVGASGAIYAILLAFGMTFPEERIFIFPLPVPIKAKWFVCGYALVELFSALATTNDSVAHFAHLGGMLFGWLLIRYWRKHPTTGNYGQSKGQQFFDRLRNNWERRKASRNNDSQTSHTSYTSPNYSNPDWEYNARKKAEQEEIDHILDKIRKSGYDSLTEAEKRKLFEQRNQ